jgi:hypothetical protein
MTKPTASSRRKRIRDMGWNQIVYLSIDQNKYWNKKADRLRARFEKYR